MTNKFFRFLLITLILALSLALFCACSPDSGKTGDPEEDDGRDFIDPSLCEHWNTYEVFVREATCYQTGIYEYYCTNCQTLMETREEEMLTHCFDDGEIITEKTCTSEEVIRYRCTLEFSDGTVCDYYEDHVGEKEPHDYVYNNEYQHELCTVCGTPDLQDGFYIYENGLLLGKLDSGLILAKVMIPGAKSLTIPAEVEGIPVVDIWQDAFVLCPDIEEIILPKGIHGLNSSFRELILTLDTTEYENGIYYAAGDNPYYYMLDVIDDEADGAFILHEDTVVLSCYAFSGSALSSIELPLGLKSIEWGAFQLCENLAEITIPEGITSIGTRVFSASGLKRINLPASVTTIGSEAFSASKIEYIDLSHVTAIESEAFKYANELETVILNDKLESLPANAFEDCVNLSLTVPDGTSITYSYICFGEIKELSITRKQLSELWYLSGYIKKLTVRGEGALYADDISNLVGLEELVIGDGITRVMPYAITNNPSLKKITFGNDVTVIEKNCLLNCPNVDTINFAEGVREIEVGAIPYADLAFTRTTENGCTYYGNSENPYFILAATYGASGALVLPEGVVIIAEGLFVNTGNLSSLTLADSVRFIQADSSEEGRWNSFFGTNIDGDIYVGSQSNPKMVLISVYQYTAGEYVVDENVKFIMPRAFKGCDRILSVVIGEGVLSVKEKALDYISANKTIPSRLGMLGTTLLPTAEPLGDKVGAINAIPEGVVYIGFGANISLPADSTYINEGTWFIGAGAFANGTVYNEYEGAYYIGTRTNPYYALIKVKSGATSVTIHSDTVLIAEYAFADATAVSTVVIPDGVRYICRNAFFTNECIRSVTIGAGVVEIGESAFHGCTELNEVVIGSNVKTIGAWAFYGCSELEKIFIPQSVISIGKYAFSGGVDRIYCRANTQPEFFATDWNTNVGTTINTTWGAYGID